MTYATRTVDNGSGTDYSVHVDSIGGADYQISKIMVGGENAASPLVFGQALAAASLPVVLPALQDPTQTQDAVYAAGQLRMVGGVRRDADTSPVSADGDVHPLVFNENGRLKTASAAAQLPVITGSITASGQTVAGDVSQASNLMIYVTGTFAGHNVTFEGSIDGGTSWFGIQAVRSNANTVETATGALGGAPAYAWELSVNALTNFRVRATAHTSGTANWRFVQGSYATEPIPAAQVSSTQPVSGTVAVSTIAGAITPGTAATSLGKARDSAIGATDTGVAALMVRRDAPTAETPAAGDYIVPQANQNGAQYVHTTFAGSAGATPYTLVSAATTNGASVKGSAGVLTSLVANNASLSAWRYIRLYNLAAAPTVGTSTAVYVVPIPPQGSVALNFPSGLGFSTGIAVAITGGSAANDATAIGAGDVNLSLAYH